MILWKNNIDIFRFEEKKSKNKNHVNFDGITNVISYAFYGKYLIAIYVGA